MKVKRWILFGVVVFILGLTIPAWSWIYVPPLGDTGWQTFIKTFNTDFTGTAGFVVSNQGDELNDSILLIDNLSHGVNKSFEDVGYTGYSLIYPIYYNGELTNFGVIDSYLWYNAPDNNHFSFQESRGVSTINFKNAFEHPGYNGSILETEINNIAGGQTFSFNWAFITWDTPTNSTPVGYDFALFYLKDDQGQIIDTQGLAQVVPVPATLILLGSGLLGLVGIKLRRRGRI